MGRKSVQEQMHRRQDVLDMMLNGKSRQHIMGFISSKYGVRTACIDLDIAACKQEMKKFSDEQMQEALQLHVNRYDRIYDDCISVGNTRDALAALKQKETLIGLHRQEPMVQVNTLNLSHVPTDELQKIKTILNKNNGKDNS